MSRKKISSYVEFLLKLINSIFLLLALATLFYGIYFLFKWKNYASMKVKPHLHKPNDQARSPARILLAFAASKWLFEEFPTPWFVYSIMAIGATLVFMSCFGFIGTAFRSPCCLCFYSILLVAFILAKIGIAALVLFAHDPLKDLPRDKTGASYSIYKFLNENWKIIRWVALAILTLDIIALFLALYLRFVYQRLNHWDYRRESLIRPDSLRQTTARGSNTRTPAPPSTGGRVQTKPRNTPS